MLSTEDMTKLGQLYLQNGCWNGKRIVSSEWVEMSIKPRMDADSRRKYCYSFWRENETDYMGSGAFGQMLFVIPGKNLVVALHSYIEGNMQPVIDAVYEEIVNRF